MASSIDWYKLDGKKVVKCNSVEEWEQWMRDGGNRIVQQSHVKDIFISTVMLGLPQNLLSFNGKEEDLILFETMIDGMGSDQEMERYTTYADAEKGHWKHVGRALMRLFTGEWKSFISKY